MVGRDQSDALWKIIATDQNSQKPNPPTLDPTHRNLPSSPPSQVSYTRGRSPAPAIHQPPHGFQACRHTMVDLLALFLFSFDVVSDLRRSAKQILSAKAALKIFAANCGRATGCEGRVRGTKIGLAEAPQDSTKKPPVSTLMLAPSAPWPSFSPSEREKNRGGLLGWSLPPSALACDAECRGPHSY